MNPVTTSRDYDHTDPISVILMDSLIAVRHTYTHTHTYNSLLTLTIRQPGLRYLYSDRVDSDRHRLFDKGQLYYIYPDIDLGNGSRILYSPTTLLGHGPSVRQWTLSSSR